MKTIRAMVDITYDDKNMHEGDENLIEFWEEINNNPENDDYLILHSNYIGDDIGTVNVVHVLGYGAVRPQGGG